MDMYRWRYSVGNTMMVIQDGEYLTPPRVFAMGIWVCYECGEVNILESNVCKQCLAERFFVVMTHDLKPAKKNVNFQLKRELL